jgi:hypothetical protein
MILIFDECGNSPFSRRTHRRIKHCLRQLQKEGARVIPPVEKASLLEAAMEYIDRAMGTISRWRR